MIPNLIVLSHATYVGPSGATAAATYAFFTKEYQPPQGDRAIDSDTIINQNGKFKYIYDNGPAFRKWAPFSIACENRFATVIGGTAAVQYAKLLEMWNYRGTLGMKAPEAVYVVNWGNSLEQNFRIFPHEVNEMIEYDVVVQLEEGQ